MLAEEISVLAQVRFDNLPMTMGLVVVPIKRVLLGFGCNMTKVHRLPGKGADAACDKHKPRKHLTSLSASHIAWRECLGAIGQIKKNRVAIKDSNLAINDCGYLRIRIDRKKCCFELLALAGVNWDCFIGKTQLFKQERDLHRVWGGVIEEFQHEAISLGDETME